MIRKSTWWLMSLAALAVAYTLIFEVDRKAPTPEMPEFLPDFSERDITGISIAYNGTNALKLVRLPERWQLVAPVHYPASPLGPMSLLDRIGKLRPLGHRDLDSTEFGFNPPRVVIRLDSENPVELQLGDLSPLNDKVYARVPGRSGIFILSKDILDVLPPTPHFWRDSGLFHLGKQRLEIDTVSIRAGPRNMVLTQNPTNQTWRVTLPAPVKRGNRARIEELLIKLWNWPVVEFVTDDPKADLEPYGLHSPGVELVLGRGTNRLAAIQFGNSPTNQPGLVYARLLNHTNVVVVEKPWLENLRAPVWDFCDHRLVNDFSPDLLARIEIQSGEPFTLQQSTNGTWRISQPTPLPADEDLVLDLLVQLRTMRAANLEREVVGDYAEFGLDQPTAQYTLRATGGTNAILSQLSFGAPKGDAGALVYVRRQDEDSVYSVAASDRQRLPSYAYQLRNRRLWMFRHEEVSKLTVTVGESSTVLLRNDSGEWTRAGKPLTVNDLQSIPTALSVLGRLQAAHWTARGADKLKQYDILKQEKSITLELIHDGKTMTRKVQFGRLSPRGNPYAFATDPLDPEPVIFEFPANTFSACEIILFPLLMPQSDDNGN